MVRSVLPLAFFEKKIKSRSNGGSLFCRDGISQVYFEVYRISFWMRSYGSPSMKRTMVITNQKVLTRLAIEALKPKKRNCTPTTRRYQDSTGQVRYAGTKRLKESQKLFDNSEVWFPTCFFGNLVALCESKKLILSKTKCFMNKPLNLQGLIRDDLQRL